MTELNTTASAAPFEPVSTELAMDDSALNAFLSHTHKHRFPAKTDVFRPGDPASTLFYVISGSLTINTEEPDGRELVLGYVNPGEFIGEMGLFFKVNRREVVLRTKGPCELAEIGYDLLRHLFSHQLSQEGPKIMFAIGAQISKRLLETSRKASRLAHLDVANRILRTLHDLSREPDAIRHPDGMQLKVSRQELARITGCSREMAGRVLKQLQQKNLLTARGKTVILFGSR
jgi:CRP/FNR family cyclic AMP-dependent transcriptional regulator